MVYITLIPFDVYATVNHYQNILFDLQVYDLYFSKYKLMNIKYIDNDWEWMLIVVSIVDYVVMIALCFVILPFTYFYAEESLENDEDIDFFEVDAYSDEDEELLLDNMSSTETSSISERIPGERRSYKRSQKNSLNRVLDKVVKSIRQTVTSIH